MTKSAKKVFECSSGATKVNVRLHETLSIEVVYTFFLSMVISRVSAQVLTCNKFCRTLSWTSTNDSPFPKRFLHVPFMPSCAYTYLLRFLSVCSCLTLGTGYHCYYVPKYIRTIIMSSVVRTYLRKSMQIGRYFSQQKKVKNPD